MEEDEDGKAQIEQVELEVPVDSVGEVDDVGGGVSVSEEVVRELGVGEYDVVRSLRVDDVDEEDEEAEYGGEDEGEVVMEDEAVQREQEEEQEELGVGEEGDEEAQEHEAALEDPGEDLQCLFLVG